MFQAVYNTHEGLVEHLEILDIIAYYSSLGNKKKDLCIWDQWVKMMVFGGLLKPKYVFCSVTPVKLKDLKDLQVDHLGS